MKAKHTSGKWIWQYDDPTCSGMNIYAENGNTPNEKVVDWVGGKNLYEAEANAKLIAAAPDLLESLIELSDLVEKLHKNAIVGKSIRKKAIDAIRKATE